MFRCLMWCLREGIVLRHCSRFEFCSCLSSEFVGRTFIQVTQLLCRGSSLCLRYGAFRFNFKLMETACWCYLSLFLSLFIIILIRGIDYCRSLLLPLHCYRIVILLWKLHHIDVHSLLYGAFRFNFKPIETACWFYLFLFLSLFIIILIRGIDYCRSLLLPLHCYRNRNLVVETSSH